MTLRPVSRSYSKPKRYNRFWSLVFWGFFWISASGQQGGVSGDISDIDGKPLPFASVFFPELNVGASSNADGKFRISLPPGQHALVIQYLGFQTLRDTVPVSDSSFTTFNYQLYPQTVILREAAVKSRKEDPAYAIMRKAIAKARFHRLQYDKYSCQVYTKGTGIIKKAPKLIARQMKKEGVQVNEAYTSESVIEVTFEQPNKISERVMAIKERRDERSPSPAPYINQSFYNPEVVGGISPLSPAAFYYYRFAYLGGFEDNGAWVSKIRVTPKTPGEGVFQGTIYIIENTWAIHSLDFETVSTGFKIKMAQIHSPVQHQIWMPVKHTLVFSGSVVGVEVEATYNAVVSNYDIKLNEALLKAAEQAIAALPPIDDEQEPYAKAHKKVAKEAERAQRKAQEEVILSERTFKIDSMARKQDSLFWERNRPIPLTDQEARGYVNADSLATFEALDSMGLAPGKKFKAGDLLFGGGYKLGKQTRLTLSPTLFQTRFNSAEGLVFQTKADLNHWVVRPGKAYKINLEPTIRFGVASQTGMGKVDLTISNRTALQRRKLMVSGGRFVNQYNAEEPISPVVNMLYTLFMRQNFMAIYQQDYLEARYHRDFGKRIEVWLGGGFYDRRALQNNSDFSFFYRNQRALLPNLPLPIEVDQPESLMPNHQLVALELKILYRPFMGYRIRNGVKIPEYDDVPEFTLWLKNGYYNNGSGFNHIRFTWEQSLSFLISGYLGWRIHAGGFINSSPLLPDFAHFNGNQTIFSPFGEMTGYRMLPYYDFSTQDWYLDQQYHYQFRKLFLSQFEKIRFFGVKEQVFLSILYTGSMQGKPFVEVGYAADRIYRIFRLELAISNQFDRPAFRIGLSTLFSF
jgi:hypothetical protein